MHSAWVVQVPLAALFCLAPVAAAVASTSIDPSVAALFVGEQVVVEGVVRSAEREGNVVHLRVGEAPQEMTVSLVLGLLSDFPQDPERHYAGKTIRAAGTVTSFRGGVEMVVRDARNVRVVDAATMPAVPNVGGSADRTLQEQLESLGEQLRRMEERLDRLERTKEAGSETGGATE